MATQTLQGLLPYRPRMDGADFAVPPPPYAELGQSLGGSQTAQRNDIILITARFRSGSTLLWNLFRHLKGVTAYYEPFNERRWFDPRARGDQVDTTHRHVEDYWREYEGLERLQTYYREDWIRRHLYMDADFWDPGMKRYVEILIEAAAGRPVLQFNRIDLRLAWFRRHFPHAKIVHLYRHPRDQWCSFLMNPACFPAHASMQQFPPHDKFYLRCWAQDLRHHFPFLEETYLGHPYQMFYYLWKLSYLFGAHYADYSLAFESLLQHPRARLLELLHAVRVSDEDLEDLQRLIVPTPLGKWREYADDAWFCHHEAVCETVLADFLASGDRTGRHASACAVTTA